jgi:hypothetical protein
MDMAFITQFKCLMLLYSCLNTGLIWVNPLKLSQNLASRLVQSRFPEGFSKRLQDGLLGGIRDPQG